MDTRTFEFTKEENRGSSLCRSGVIVAICIQNAAMKDGKWYLLVEDSQNQLKVVTPQ